MTSVRLKKNLGNKFAFVFPSKNDLSRPLSQHNTLFMSCVYFTCTFLKSVSITFFSVDTFEKTSPLEF